MIFFLIATKLISFILKSKINFYIIFKPQKCVPEFQNYSVTQSLREPMTLMPQSIFLSTLSAC